MISFGFLTYVGKGQMIEPLKNPAPTSGEKKLLGHLFCVGQETASWQVENVSSLVS